MLTRPRSSIEKAPKTSGSRRKQPRAEGSVSREVSPEAIERMAKALAAFVCAVDHPGGSESVTGDEKPTRAAKGAEYVAAIAEQRPGVAGHGYPGGYPDWDQRFRLSWSGTTRHGEFSNDRSILLPDWMALPLVRSLLQDPDLRNAFIASADKSGETDPGKINNA